MLTERGHQLVRAIDSPCRPVGLFHRPGERIAMSRSAEDRATQVRNTADGVTCQRYNLILAQKPSVCPVDAVDLPTPVDGRKSSGADDRV